MRELSFVEPGRLEWRDAPEPALAGDGEALVRPLSSFEPELATGETADWEDAAEAIAEHRAKLVVSRERA